MIIYNVYFFISGKMALYNLFKLLFPYILTIFLTDFEISIRELKLSYNYHSTSKNGHSVWFTNPKRNAKSKRSLIKEVFNSNDMLDREFYFFAFGILL